MSTRRALLFLPDLTVSTLAWSLAHPVHRSGVARWWHKGAAASYLPGLTTTLDLLWPKHQVEWSDLGRFLQANPAVARQLQSGGTFRVTTGVKMVDWIPPLQRLQQQFPAVEVVVDLLVDPNTDLTPWLEADLSLGIITPATPKQAVLLENKGVHLNQSQVKSYIQSRSDWSPIVVTKVGQEAVWVVDDRLPALKTFAALDPFVRTLSELEAARGTNLAKLVHNQHDLCWQKGVDGVTRELTANPNEQLLITADSVTAESWPVVDDQLTRLLTRLYQHCYSTLVVGAPQSKQDGAYPLFLVDSAQNASYQPVQRPISTQDVADATWEFIGASSNPSWLLRNFVAV